MRPSCDSKTISSCLLSLLMQQSFDAAAIFRRKKRSFDRDRSAERNFASALQYLPLGRIVPARCQSHKSLEVHRYNLRVAEDGISDSRPSIKILNPTQSLMPTAVTNAKFSIYDPSLPYLLSTTDCQSLSQFEFVHRDLAQHAEQVEQAEHHAFAWKPTIRMHIPLEYSEATYA